MLHDGVKIKLKTHQIKFPFLCTIRQSAKAVYGQEWAPPTPEPSEIRTDNNAPPIQHTRWRKPRPPLDPHRSE